MLLPYSRSLTSIRCCFPSRVSSVWFFSTSIAGWVRYMTLSVPASVLGKVKFPMVVRLRLTIMVLAFKSTSSHAKETNSPCLTPVYTDSDQRFLVCCWWQASINRENSSLLSGSGLALAFFSTPMLAQGFCSA